MNFRRTGILALANVFFALLIVFWDRDEDTARERMERARRAFRFDPARVDRLVIHSGDLALECQLQGRQWRLRQPIAARADPVAIEQLLDALQELPRGDIILPPRRSTDAYIPYGLDVPRASIAIIEGTATNLIFFGRRTPLGDGVYVRQSRHGGVARIKSSLLDLIPASADALRDRALLAGTPPAIARLDIRSPSGYIQLARGPAGEWRMFQPATARADAAAVGALLETLLACTVVEFVQDSAGDLAPYGLDSPSAVTAVLNTDPGDGTQLLALGDPLPNDKGLVYARLQAENSIYAVPATVRQTLLVKPDDLRDRRIPGLDPDTIRRVRIEEGEAALEFHRADDGSWQLDAPVRAPAEADAIQALLRSWAEVRLTAFESQPPSNPPPLARRIQWTAGQEPALSVELLAGPDPVDSAAARIAITGDSSVAIATPARLLESPLDPLLYRSRRILAVPLDDIRRLQFQANGQTVQAERDPATGQWTPAAPWVDNAVAALASLRAEYLIASGVPNEPESVFGIPFLKVVADLRGQSGLAAELWVGPELTPGGPRRAFVRGRDLLFALAPAVVDALRPPPVKGPE